MVLRFFGYTYSMSDPAILFQKKLETLEAEMRKPEVLSDAKKYSRLSREYKTLKEKLDMHRSIEKMKSDSVSLETDYSREKNLELKNLLREEIDSLKKKQAELAGMLHELENPQDPNDQRNVIMEIRAGTGGDESTLFAAELFRMYSRFAEKRGWRTNIISSNRTGLGGFKEVILSIEGDHAYQTLKYEMGVHRVQRVPETEKSGRVHTSAATVAVLPEAEEVDVEIKPQDIRIDTFMSGGHGGQSVNTTYSAVRITHLPTKMVITCQDERSQLQNRMKAMTILRSRLLAMEDEKRRHERSKERRKQIGTGDRGEKIRTYNFPQDRLTDHRIKKNWHQLTAIMDGELEPIIEALNAEAQELQ